MSEKVDERSTDFPQLSQLAEPEKSIVRDMLLRGMASVVACFLGS